MKSNQPLITICIFLLAIFISPITISSQTTQHDGKGVGNRNVDKLPSENKHWALVIGVDNYRDDISPLYGSVNDAKALKNALVQNGGFPEKQVILMTTDSSDRDLIPNRGNILFALDKLSRQIPEDGLLLFSFSGHGVSVGKDAFLIPSDGRIYSNPELLRDGSVDVLRVKKAIEATKATQVLMLLDACRNDPLKGKGDAPNNLTEAYSRGFSFDKKNEGIKAFATIYATSFGDRAFEFYDKQSQQHRGFFSYAIEEGLKGKAANNEGEITLGGLISYIEKTVKHRVYVEKNQRQIPYPIMEGFGSQLVLSLAQIAKVEPKPTPRPTPLSATPQKNSEQLYWENVVKENTIASYESYLQNYPQGDFRQLANSRISKFKADELAKQKEKEKQFWKNVQQANTIVAYRIYKQTYPNGEFVSNADSKIKNLQSIKKGNENQKLKHDLVINVGDSSIGNFEELFEQALMEGNTSRNLREYIKSEDAYNRAKSINPKDFRATYGLGNIYSDQMRWEEAEKVYRQAILLEPDDPGLYFAISFVLSQPVVGTKLSKRYEEAEKMARKAIELAPKNAIGYEQLGIALELQGFIDVDTQNAYRKAIELNPSYALAYAHLGRVLRKNGLTKESSDAYRKAIQFSTDVPSMILVADVMQSLQRFEDSEILLRTALEQDPKNPTGLYLLGRALTIRKSFKEAETVLKKGVEVSPNSVVSYTLLGSMYYKSGDLIKAEETLIQALTIVTNNEKKRLVIEFEELGDRYLKINKNDAALRVYLHAQELDKENQSIINKISNAPKNN